MLALLSPSHGRAAAGPDQARQNLARSLVRLFVVIAALCIFAMPLLAAERETRVLFINGVDPTLPAFLLMDAATRDTLARN